MTVFDIAFGVAAGILLAAVIIGSVLHILHHEANGTEERGVAYAGVVVPMVLILLGLYGSLGM